MESNERHEDHSTPTGSWSDFAGNIYNPSTHALQGSSQQFPYVKTIPDGNFYPNQDQIGYSVNNHYQGFFTAGYSQDSSVSLQASDATHCVVPRVHLNPNYRPKVPLPYDKDAGPNRLASVYVNPHWRGRQDLAPSTESGLKNNNNSSERSGKKTIFINPKILAQYNMGVSNLAASSLSTDLKDKYTVQDTYQFHAGSTDVQQMLPCPKNVSNQTTLSKSSQSQANRTFGTESKDVASRGAEEPAFVVLSSTKLVRRANISSIPKKSDSNHLTNQGVEHISDLQPVRGKSYQLSANCRSNPSLKIARQVCSKYKFVRNVSSAASPMKVANGLSIDPAKRLRRRSLSSKASTAQLLKSAYKFVRKPASYELPLRLVQKVQSNDSLASNTSPKENSLFRGKVHKSTSKNLKSGNQLVKNKTLHQTGSIYINSSQSKDVQSRYKLIRHYPSDLKYSHRNKSKFQQSNAPNNLALSPLCVKSRFKISRNSAGSKTMSRRKVSRFRVTHIPSTSEWKVKSSPVMSKPRKIYQSLIFGSPVMRKRQMYGNLIWKKEKSLVCSQQKTQYMSSRKGKFGAMPNKFFNRCLVNGDKVFERLTPESSHERRITASKERIVHIRGKKFILNAKETILRPALGSDVPAQQSNDKRKEPSFKRIDLGGVTFTRRNDDTFVRTNRHHTRSILSNAKIRSIALLTDKLRKNNQPCLIFHRFGKCHAYEDGKCWRVHDPKNIAICRKFLQGNCTVVNCLLSHNVGPEKMPTCRYFLEGCCVRDNCPYLHVKLSAAAPICRQFLHGYCADGDECKRRHVHLCPDFDQDGRCSKGKHCPYPHKSKDTKKSMRLEVKYSTNGKLKNPKKIVDGVIKHPEYMSCTEAEKRKRYYDESTADNIEGCTSNSLISDAQISKEQNSYDNLDDAEESQNFIKRPQIGILPAYIPLE